MTLRTIHVGVGGRGWWPVDVMGTDSHFAPVAVVDLNADFRERAKAHLGLPDTATFADLGTALEQVEADAVVICTPTRTHGPLARLAFAAEKHVLVEKGMTLDWDEAKALVDEAREAGVKFCVAQNYRYNANELAVTEILNDPTHAQYPGRVEIVDYIHHRYRPEPRTLDYPNAMVWDMSCHHVDSLSCWLGPAHRVTARSYNTTWSKYTHDADIAAFIEYESGAVCHYILTHTATLSEWRVTLQGEQGALRLYDAPGVRFFPRPQGQLGSSEPVPIEVASRPKSEQGVADAFYRYIAEDIEPGISGRNNLDTLAVCEMLVRSARDGRPVERGEL